MQLISLILIFELLTFNALSLQITDSLQTASKDSIVFYEFDGSLYRASSYNNIAREDEEGILYIGNENGLLEFDGTHWQMHQNSNFTPVVNLKIIGDKIYTVGGGDVGYYQRDSIGRMQYHSMNDKLDEEEMPYIWYMAESNGKVYYSSLNKGIYYFDGELIKNIDVSDAYSMVEVNDEVIISIFGKNGGLAKFDGDTIEYVNKEFKFEDDAAYNIIQKNDGEWIIFTSEEGFYTLDPETYETELWDNEANQYFLQDSMYLYSIRKFQDSLFVASSWTNGVIIFNDEGKILHTLNEENGLKTNYYNAPLADRRGNLWLASGSGLNYLKFYAENEKLNFKPKALVRYMRVGDSTIFIKGGKDKVILTGNNTKSFGLYFSAPSFIKEDLEFSYYLEGFDEGWSEWTSDTRKEYTNLSGDNYVFHLRARDIYNKDLEILPFEFNIIVPTKWYENYITFLFIGLFVGLLIFGFIRYRTHRLSISNKKLEELVKERTYELRSQKERLKEANAELKVINNELDNFVYRSSHDLVAPLKSLRGLISVAGMSNNTDELLEYFRLMNISITKLEEFIKSIMDFSTNTKKPLELKLVRLDDILDSIIEDLKFYENAEKVKLIRAYDSNFEIRTDPKRLNIVLSNLVTNALKYHDFDRGISPFIKVSAKIESDTYIVEVEDNGSGIPEEYQSKIFDMFFRAHQGTDGSGLGLYIVVDTLNVLKGDIKLTSKVRKGTIFKIVLPIMD
ncbi:HAMP domain-containing sensor histidine kinase [Marivirga sp.]|uniref:sensor histidine kinase n=1 Tax=Marivirga sp. TaxID=2018662 RepID=UPI0025F512D0|nr:HAMP domain-containing sensor histidine kinase [Marivirga sp.]